MVINMLIAIIILTVAIMGAKKEHEKILEKLERMERIEQKRKEGS